MVKATFTLKSACQYCLAVLFLTAFSLGLSAQITTTFSGQGLPADVGTLDGGVTAPENVVTTSDATVNFGFSGVIGTNATLDQVQIDITHSWANDIDATLISPAGTRLALVMDQGFLGDDNFENTVFQDGGASIVGADAPFTGVFEPQGGTFAAAFDGEEITGDWTLEIIDDQSFDFGTLNEFDITFTAEDLNPDDCPFVDNEVACIANVNVTLGESCTAVITPSMVLAGAGVDCASNISITIDGGTSNMIIGCGEHTYMATVTDPLDNVTYTCWGNILAEDKTDPVVTCPDDTDSVDFEQRVNFFEGALETTDDQLELSVYSCFQELLSPVPGLHFYDTYTFTPTTTDIYTFIGELIGPDFNANIALFAGEFNPDEPCQNIIAHSEALDFTPIGSLLAPGLRLSMPLIAGETYTLFVSSRTPAGATGDYRIYSYADGNGSIPGLPFEDTLIPLQLALPLICADIDEVAFDQSYSWVLNSNGTLDFATTRNEFFGGSTSALIDFLDRINLTGLPIASDNCSRILVTVTDEITEAGDCGDWTIARTFTITDGYNSDCAGATPRTTECTQEITVRKPSTNDLFLPPFTAPIECDENYPTDGADGGPDDNPHPSLTGYPFIMTTFGYRDLSQVQCNLGASYSDEPRIDVCDGTFKYRREWNIINWCNPSENFTYDQFITVGDYTGPEIQGLPDVVNASTSPFSCVANVQLPCPTLVDGCSSSTTATYTVLAFGDAFFAGGVLCEGDVVQAPIGEHTLIICAEDDCGNETCEEFTLNVSDEIEPYAVCDDELNISIGGGDIASGIEGIARISAEDIDEGSSDNCSEVTLDVRRNFWRNNTCNSSPNRWSPWGEYVDFYCCDIGNEITIELRVTDESGNVNVCWMVVTPEDKLNPFCFAPEDVELTCTELPLTFPGNIQEAYDEDFNATSLMMDATFGAATGTDNCAVDTIVERTPNVAINECGWGTITRRFEVWQLRPEGDVNGNGAIDITEVFRSNNNCTQTIEITEVHDFVIDFPEDAEAECGDPEIPTIITSAEGCDVLSVNIGDPVRFSATGSECYKLSITYDVINWCLWDGEYTGHVVARMTEDDGEALPIDRAVEGNERPVIRYNDDDGLCMDRNHNDRDGNSSLTNCGSPVLPNYGRYIYTQFVKVYDATAPVVTVGDYGGPTDNCPDLEPGQFGDDDGNCTENVIIPFTVSDECELFDDNGDLVINIISAELSAFAVDANGDGEINALEFTGGVNVLSNITDNGDGTYVFEGEFPIIPAAMGDNVLHAVRILFGDGCGSQTAEYIEFDVIDCKGPAPVCINGLTVTLMPQDDGGCAMAIWASDFEGSPISDCTGQGPDEFLGQPRVTKYAIYRASTVEADPNFVPNPNDTGLVLTDEDEETTIVLVYAFDEEGNYDFCETYVLVQQHLSCNLGGVGTIAGVIATENAETVEGVEVNVNGGALSMVTNTDGTYSFENLETGDLGDYSVAPYLNASPLNGVSTFDLVLMSKHILGVDPLSSAYKMIAADVNNSQTITTLDLIQLRKLILNIDTEFQNNTSWRFVNADYNFPVPSNPWFAAFPEVGNVNDLATDQLVNIDFVGVKIGDVNDSATANALAGDDRTMNGQFNFSVENGDLVAGNVYTVAFRGADMASVEGFQGTLNLNEVELVDIEYGVATAENFGLRYADRGMITTSWNGDATAEDVLFSLVIRATSDMELNEAISVSSRYTEAEAYGNGNTMNVGVIFSNGELAEAGFEVYQNTPNPFRAETLIGFNLPEDAEATLTISDASGRVLTVLRGDYAAGYNTINVSKEMIQGASGVLSYTITAGEYTTTKKMIAVK